MLVLMPHLRRYSPHVNRWVKNWRNGQGFRLNQTARWRVFWIRTRGWVKAGGGRGWEAELRGFFGWWRYVSSCGYVSLGLGTVVVVPGVLVHGVWKGTPQDCMDHVWGAHDVPWDVKSASSEQFVPPWTVQHQVWSDSLKASHSGISTDVLLFSDINLSLIHHYQIHKRGHPHIAFRKDYLARLRALLSPAVARSRGEMLSPVSSGPVSTGHARSAELESESRVLSLYKVLIVWFRGVGLC